MQMAPPPLLVLSASSQSLISPSLCYRFSPPHRRPLAAGRCKFLIQEGPTGRFGALPLFVGVGGMAAVGMGVKNMEFARR